MKIKTLKPLANFGQIKKRISTVAAIPPAKPLKGRGFERVEITETLVFAKLQRLAPNHCEAVTNREAINRFGKLGFAPHCYLSPEMHAVYAANDGEFRRLEAALQTVAESNL